LQEHNQNSSSLNRFKNISGSPSFHGGSTPVIQRKYLIIKELVNGCLRESGFDKEETKYVSKLAYGLNWNKDEPPTPVKNSVSNWMTRLAFVLVHSWRKTTSGKFSLTYNLDLKSSVKRKNTKRIEDLWMSTGPENLFPEVYNNKMLSKSEKNSVQNIYIREYTAILNALRKLTEEKTFNKSDTLFSDFKGAYDTCYRKISENSDKLIDSLTTNGVVFVPNGNIVKSGSLVVNNVKAYEFMDLITILARQKMSGCSTNKVTNNLLRRYNKEVSMMIIYLDKMPK